MNKPNPTWPLHRLQGSETKHSKQLNIGPKLRFSSYLPVPQPCCGIMRCLRANLPALDRSSVRRSSTVFKPARRTASTEVLCVVRTCHGTSWPSVSLTAALQRWPGPRTANQPIRSSGWLVFIRRRAHSLTRPSQASTQYTTGWVCGQQMPGQSRAL